jgi:hypothetical protein
VVDPPGFDDPSRGRQVGEQMLIEAFTHNLPMKLSATPFCIGLPGAM